MNRHQRQVARDEKQIKTLHLFRLLSLEMLHTRVEIEKQDFRKLSSEKGMRITPICNSRLTLDLMISEGNKQKKTEPFLPLSFIKNDSEVHSKII